MDQALVRYEAGGEVEFVAFATAVEGFCDFYLRHMQKGEALALPLAEKLFCDRDWARMHASRAAARYARGAAAEGRAFRQLFRRIVAQGPPPPAARPSTTTA